MGCGKTLTIQPAQVEMPLDQAVYSASTNKIYGVRGGYLFELSPTTGSILRSVRFACPTMGEGSVAFDTVNGKVFCSTWNDKAAVNNGDTDYDIITTRKLYRVDPVAMALETSAEINPIIGFQGYIAASQSQYAGPHRIIFDGTSIVCAMGVGNPASVLCSINPLTLASSVNGESLDWTLSMWKDFCYQPAGSEPAQIWIVDDDASIMPCAYPAITYASGTYYEYDATNYAAPYNIAYGVCFCASNSKIYATCRKPLVLAFTPDTVNPTFAVTTINTADTNATPYRISYNAYNGLIYVPGFKSNNVVVIDPATDTVVATYTGFDSPFDCVFTPTKSFAVQLGNVGLREIA